MEGISAASTASLMQSVLAQAELQGNLNMAVLQRTQEIAKQQGAAAVQLIEAAGDTLIDFRA